MDEAQASEQAGDAIAHQVDAERIDHPLVEQAEAAGPFRDACTTCAGVKRRSLTQAWTNFWKPIRSSWLAGMPATSIGLASVVMRTVAVWHTAQLRKTRSMPRCRRFDMPTGRSRPGSKMKPSD